MELFTKVSKPVLLNCWKSSALKCLHPKGQGPQLSTSERDVLIQDYQTWSEPLYSKFFFSNPNLK